MSCIAAARIRVAFVAICRDIGLLTGGVVAVDGSQFKAVNTRDKNYTPGAVRRRIEQTEASIKRYLEALDAADRQDGEEAQLREGPAGYAAAAGARPQGHGGRTRPGSGRADITH